MFCQSSKIGNVFLHALDRSSVLPTHETVELGGIESSCDLKLSAITVLTISDSDCNAGSA